MKTPDVESNVKPNQLHMPHTVTDDANQLSNDDIMALVIDNYLTHQESSLRPVSEVSIYELEPNMLGTREDYCNQTGAYARYLVEKQWNIFDPLEQYEIRHF